MVECLCYSPTLLHGRLKAHLRFIVEHASKHTGARPLSPRMCLCFVFRVWRPAVKHACFVFRVWRGRGNTRVSCFAPGAGVDRAGVVLRRLARPTEIECGTDEKSCAGGCGWVRAIRAKGSRGTRACSCQGGGGARSFRMRRPVRARSGGMAGWRGKAGGRSAAGLSWGSEVEGR